MRFQSILIIILFCSSAVHADNVEPTERVTTRVIVREGPSTQTSDIGSLRPGEMLPHAGSVPHWHQVTLPDGRDGFVSKAWTRIIPSDGPEEVLRVGSWNIKKLGHGGNKNFSLVAQIIEDHYDIVAVVEVMQKSGTHPGYDSLLAELGDGWQGLVTDAPRPNTNAGHSEYYAVFFRPNRISLCQDWSGLVYHQENDGGDSGTGSDNFSREPAFACFSASNPDGLIGFDFMLAPYHAVFAEGDIDDISAEVSQIDKVFQSMASAQPGELDLIIAGDFNLVPVDLEDALDREIATLGTGSTLNGTGALTQNLYDHLVPDDASALTEMIGTAEVIDVRKAAADNETFFRTVSDHLPLVASFRVTGPDDD